MWRLPEQPPTLTQNEVQVWRVSLEQPLSQVEALMQVLADDERQRALRFRRQSDRHHFIVGRGALRQLLGQHLAIAPHRVQFCYSARGKPALVDQALQFNVSHSHGLALIAIAQERRIGVDLEQIRPVADLDQLVQRFFSPREYAQFCALPPEQRLNGFFQGWTSKEAYLKAIGEGLAQLEQVEVSLLPDAPARLLNLSAAPQTFAHWSLQTLQPAPGYTATLAVEGHDWYSTCWQYFG